MTNDWKYIYNIESDKEITACSESSADTEVHAVLQPRHNHKQLAFLNLHFPGDR